MASQTYEVGHVKSFSTPMMDNWVLASRAMRLEFIENFDYSPIRKDLAKDLGWDEEKIAEVERKAKAFFSCFLAADGESFLSPDEEIDQFWHPFIVVTPKNWTVDEEKSNYPVRGLRWASVDGFHPSSRRSGSWS